MKNQIKQMVMLSVVVIMQSFVGSVHAEFGTLFTTASERKIIDDNRYIVKKVKQKKPTTITKVTVEEPKEIIYETITKEYKISGISIANNGIDTAWINSKLYEHGEMLDKKTKLSIQSSDRKLRFTVRGGKTFYGQSGDTVTVSYRVPLME